jgi:hypothetical protein
MGDAKIKPESNLRIPKAKKKLGLTVPPPLRMPHEGLIASLVEKNPQEPSMTSQTSHTSHALDHSTETISKTGNYTNNNDLLSQSDESASLTGSNIDLLASMTSQTSHTSSNPVVAEKSAEVSIAPQKDFTRVANSIVREAVPTGLFKGKSKQLYDCLYALTRGAVVPSRSIRMSRPKLMAAAGIGARVTFDTNIAHLCSVGLLEVRTITGEHNGNEYRVYLPEERTIPSLTSQTRYAHKLVRLVRLETSQTRHTLNPEESIVYEVPKTFFKTDDDDTHTLVLEFVLPILEMAREILGGPLPTSEQERLRWKECASVLTDELRTAASRAVTISSVPAFLTAHLRRRFKARMSPPNRHDMQAEKSIDTGLKRESPSGKVGQAEQKSNRDRGSKFSLDDCRRYADHLHKSGQGIVKPGGYATTIFRTGEADSLIERFLNPEIPKDLDISKCPDCKGTGFTYPEGIAGGVVAKCKHEKLQTALRLFDLLTQLRLHHAGDSAYQRSDLIEDLKYQCEREEVTWDAEVVNSLIDP